MTENETIPLTSIVEGTRLRKDYGDLSDLDTISEVGLIQPIVLDRQTDGTYALVAGGRRLRKITELGFTELHHGVTSDPNRIGYVFSRELPEDVRREIELYENIGRKQMSWQERILSIADIHALKLRRAALDGESWGLRETGRELGVSVLPIYHAVTIAKELRKTGSKIGECKTPADALRYIIEQKENELNQGLAKMTVPHVISSAPIPVTLNNETKTEEELKASPPLIVPLSKMLFNARMEDLLKGDLQVDTILTDWPYGIAMANLSQSNTGMDVSRVEDEHVTKENIQNFELWLKVMFKSLKDPGFCVIFFDITHWHYMSILAQTIGFRVQRWPLVWVKTHPCLNQQAFKNFTKATEFAMVLSKGNAVLAKTQSTNYWTGPRETSTSNPFAKPKGLWHWIMSAVCTPGESILDPFAGEGSEVVAAIEFGLRPLAIEVEGTHYNQLVTNTKETYIRLLKGNVTFE